jgi:hypothetical protein
MGLKKYIFASIIVIIAVFGYTFSIAPGDYTIKILDYTIVLPIAAWVTVPVVFLFITTVTHILYYGLKNYFALKAVSKDSETLVTLINKKLLNESGSNLTFKSNDFKKLSEVISQLDLNVSDSNFSSSNKEINKTVDQLFTIKSGKYVSSKELKLDNTNPVMIDNIQNRIKQEEDFALDVVKNSAKYSQEIQKDAFMKVLETKSMTTVKKVIETLELDVDMLLALLKKDSEQKSEFAMTNDVILKLMQKVTLTNKQLITIASNYKILMTPDQLIKLYEDLAAHNEDYTTAYLYVLSQYEMIDKMRDILENSATNEFIAFKALVDLKDSGKHSYSLDSLCYQ